MVYMYKVPQCTDCISANTRLISCAGVTKLHAQNAVKWLTLSVALDFSPPRRANMTPLEP